MEMIDKLGANILIGSRVLYSDRYASTSHTLRLGVVYDLSPSTGLPVVIRADHSGKTAARSPSDVVVIK